MPAKTVQNPHYDPSDDLDESNESNTLPEVASDATSYAISRDIPIPPRARRSGKYPELSLLNIGDSFFVPEVEPRQISSLASFYGRSQSKRFACRSVTETHPTTGQPARGVRIWRVELS